MSHSEHRTSNIELRTTRRVSLAETTSTVPKVGEPLPDFRLLGTDGATHAVADLVRDRRGMVLFYFPKANTDG